MPRPTDARSEAPSTATERGARRAVIVTARASVERFLGQMQRCRALRHD